MRYAFLTSGPSDRAKALVVPDHVDPDDLDDVVEWLKAIGHHGDIDGGCMCTLTPSYRLTASFTAEAVTPGSDVMDEDLDLLGMLLVKEGDFNGYSMMTASEILDAAYDLYYEKTGIHIPFDCALNALEHFVVLFNEEARELDSAGGLLNSDITKFVQEYLSGSCTE